MFGNRGMGNKGDNIRRGAGAGRGGGLGAVGKCVCTKCGYQVAKKAGMPCIEQRCPKCGTALFREGGVHYTKTINKQK